MLFYQARPNKTELMWLWCENPEKKLSGALAKKAIRMQKGLKHVFKKWLQDAQVYSEEQLSLPAVERRRLFLDKNVNRSAAALKRQREGDGKFISEPKQLFHVEKVRFLNVADFLVSEKEAETRKRRKFETNRV